MLFSKESNRFFIFDREKPVGVRRLAIEVIDFLRSIAWKIKMHTLNVATEKKKYEVALCAIFKNEAPYLREWIEFHRQIGVEHFYLYNNNSNDAYEEMLEPYVSSGIVTLIDWPKNQAQMQAYADCVQAYSHESSWIGFIDIDEFVVPNHFTSIADFLSPFKKNAGSVLLYWKVFGTSGMVDRKQNGLVTEDFTVCWDRYSDIGKCFYNTAFSLNCESEKNRTLHHRLWAGYNGTEFPPVNPFGRVCVGRRNSVPSDQMPIQINHYFTKSYREYVQKSSRGDVFFKMNPHDDDYFYRHEMKCRDVDYSAYRYLVKLKRALAG